jgi:hypothetical protein
MKAQSLLCQVVGAKQYDYLIAGIQIQWIDVFPIAPPFPILTTRVLTIRKVGDKNGKF